MQFWWTQISVIWLQFGQQSGETIWSTEILGKLGLPAMFPLPLSIAKVNLPPKTICFNKPFIQTKPSEQISEASSLCFVWGRNNRVEKISACTYIEGWFVLHGICVCVCLWICASVCLWKRKSWITFEQMEGFEKNSGLARLASNNFWVGSVPAQSSPGRPWPAPSSFPWSGAAPWSLVLPGHVIPFWKPVDKTNKHGRVDLWFWAWGPIFGLRGGTQRERFFWEFCNFLCNIPPEIEF